MIYLILGLLIWTSAHVMKRVAPGLRASLGDGPGKGIVTGLLVLSIWLMVKGYGQVDGPIFWGRSPMLVGLNNLLMLFAVYLFAVSGLKTALARCIRHPMLAAVKVWALAHLLVNGDLGSFVLFGGLLFWSMVHVIVINKSEPAWVRPDPQPREKEVKAVGTSVVFFAIISGIHAWLGYSPIG